MKIMTFVALLCAAMFQSCSDDLRVELDIADADSYVNIYMPAANYSPNVKNVYITPDVQTISVSAFYGGPKLPQRDITVEFEVCTDLVDAFNQANGTSYLPMPEGSYSLSEATATIAKGKSSSNLVPVEITAEGYLAVAKPYLLPVSIKSVSDTTPVSETLNTAYYLISGSYLPGQVPREKVFSFGHKIDLPIFCRNSDVIRLDEDGGLQLYQLNEKNVYAHSRQFGWGWAGTSILFYMPNNRFIARNASNNMTHYNVDENYNFGAQHDFGWGWQDVKFIFPFKDLAIIGITGGVMTKYPLNQNSDFDWGGITGIGSGWDFVQIFAIDNTVIAIDSAGDMWGYPLSDSSVFGSRRKIGTGWNIYNKVFQCEDKLLAIDENGDMWRYQFDVNAYWPLKAEDEPSEETPAE